MAAYIVKGLRLFADMVAQPSSQVATAKIRRLGDASVRITRYRGGVVHSHEPDEHGSFAVGRCYQEKDAYPQITTSREFYAQESQRTYTGHAHQASG
jgi:hypothetical protein